MVIYGINGGVAQLAKAIGSYPIDRRFKSYRRYQLSASIINWLKYLVYSKPACMLVHQLGHE